MNLCSRRLTAAAAIADAIVLIGRFKSVTGCVEFLLLHAAGMICCHVPLGVGVGLSSHYSQSSNCRLHQTDTGSAMSCVVNYPTPKGRPRPTSSPAPLHVVALW
jgi:hypothetical protein